MANTPTNRFDDPNSVASIEQMFSVLQIKLGLPEAEEIARSSTEQQQVFERILGAVRGTRERVNETQLIRDMEGEWTREMRRHEQGGVGERVSHVQDTVVRLALRALGPQQFQAVNRIVQAVDQDFTHAGVTRTLRVRAMLQANDEIGAMNVAQLADHLLAGNETDLTNFLPRATRLPTNRRGLVAFLNDLYEALGRGPQEPLCPVVLPVAVTNAGAMLLTELNKARDQRLLFTAYTYLQEYPDLINELRPAASTTLPGLRSMKTVSTEVHHLEHATTITVPRTVTGIPPNATHQQVENRLTAIERGLETEYNALDLAVSGAPEDPGPPIVPAIRPNPAAAEGIRRRIGGLETQQAALQELMGKLEELEHPITHLAHALHALHGPPVNFDFHHDTPALEAVLNASHDCDRARLRLNINCGQIVAEVRARFPDMKEASEYTADIRTESSRTGAILEGDVAAQRIIERGLAREGVPAAQVEAVAGITRARLGETRTTARQAERQANAQLPAAVNESTAREQFDRARPIPESLAEQGKAAVVGGVLMSTAGPVLGEAVNQILLSWKSGLGYGLAGGLGALGGHFAGKGIGSLLADSDIRMTHGITIGTGLAVGGLSAAAIITLVGMTITTGGLGALAVGGGVGLAYLWRWINDGHLGARDPKTAEAIRQWAPAIGTAVGATLGLTGALLYTGVQLATLGPTLATLATAAGTNLVARGLFHYLVEKGMRAGGASERTIETWRQRFATGGTVVGGLAGGLASGGLGLVGVGLGAVAGWLFRKAKPSAEASAYEQYKRNILEEVDIQETDSIETMDTDDLSAKYFQLRLLATDYRPEGGNTAEHPGRLQPTPDIIRMLTRMHATLVERNADHLLTIAGPESGAAAGAPVNRQDLLRRADEGLATEYGDYIGETANVEMARDITERAYQEIRELHARQTEDPETGDSMWAKFTRWRKKKGKTR